MTRVLVTGSRRWSDVRAVEGALLPYFPATPQDPPPVLVHGACSTGLDLIADRVGRFGGWVIEPHPANWAALGKAAGPARNQEMVDRGADVCLAFPLTDSRGTYDCMNRAMAAGIPVQIIAPAGAVPVGQVDPELPGMTDAQVRMELVNIRRLAGRHGIAPADGNGVARSTVAMVEELALRRPR